MDKQLAYKQLVDKRKKYQFANGLTNPSSTSYDVDEIDPWAQWQNNIDAEILVVGQEYSDVETYNRTKSKVECYPNRYEYPSNKNLKEYFEILGYDIGHPLSPNQNNPIFFTNAVTGLKQGSMSGNFRDSWLKESREHFLKPLIDIIQPRIIITIGAKATKSLGVIYNFKVTTLKSMLETSPIKSDTKLIFPVYHIGGLGLSNRPKAQQIVDWSKIKKHL